MIAGLQKMTLLDYPGKVACTVFLQGCNYRCPFCHNSELLPHGGEPFMAEEEFFAFLQKRKGLLDGVCVSGGEPTLYPGLSAFLKRIKELGYAVKLDTNGGRPDVLQQVAQEGLVDYVAMDVKNSPGCYPETTGVPGLRMDKTTQSLRFLIGGGVDYELRTTVVAQLHSEESIREMGEYLSTIVPGKKPRILYLQSFTDRDTVAFSGLSAPSETEMACYAKALEPFVEQVCLRGQ